LLAKLMRDHNRRTTARFKQERDVLRIIFATTAVVALPLIGIASAASGSAPAPVQAPPAFAQCKACHSVDPGGKAGLGPNLHGVGGKIAGTKAGFSFSPAMKSARKRWDRANLDAFIKDPQALVPGTKMMSPGVTDPQKRKQIVDYLLALS
jgi:cytochrome c